MAKTLERALIAAAVVLCAGLSPSAYGQDKKVERPLVVVGAEGGYSRLQRSGAGLKAFIPLRPWTCADGWCALSTIELQGSTGTSGWRVAGGHAIVGVIWTDALATLTRTHANPLRAAGESTYLGGEVGLGFPVWAFPGERLVTVRPSIGVAHRVRGPAGPHSTVFTWSIGAHVFLQRLGD